MYYAEVIELLAESPMIRHSIVEERIVIEITISADTTHDLPRSSHVH